MASLIVVGAFPWGIRADVFRKHRSRFKSLIGFGWPSNSGLKDSQEGFDCLRHWTQWWMPWQGWWDRISLSEKNFSKIDGDDTRLIRFDPWGSSPRWPRPEKQPNVTKVSFLFSSTWRYNDNPILHMYDPYQLWRRQGQGMDLADMPVRTRGEQTFTFYSKMFLPSDFRPVMATFCLHWAFRNLSRGGANKVFPHPRKRIPHLNSCMMMKPIINHKFELVGKRGMQAEMQQKAWFLEWDACSYTFRSWNRRRTVHRLGNGNQSFSSVSIL
jgi:hypothetical protein